MQDFLYVTKWSTDFTDQFIRDFVSVQNQVLFNGSYSEAFFRKKYVDNPYGRSLVIVVYDNEMPIAAQAYWRNDIDGKLAYQSADSSVIRSYQHKGLFTKIISIINECVEKEAIVYGFPNLKSFPAFMKMGWNLIDESRPCLFISSIQMSNERKIPYEYAKWWIVGNRDLYYIKRFNHYYIVRKRHNKPICRILGETDAQTAKLFSPYNKFAILSYSSRCKLLSLFRLTPTRTIALRHKDIVLPLWKVDAM